MGFSKLSPPEKVKSGVLKIFTAQWGGKNARFKTVLSIPSALFTQAFGTAERLDLFAGDGADAGKLMLKPAEGEGGFKVKRMKFTCMVDVPHQDQPEITLMFDRPQCRVRSGESMVIDLPAWAHQPGAWREIQKAREAAKRIDAANPTNRRDAIARIGALK